MQYNIQPHIEVSVPVILFGWHKSLERLCHVSTEVRVTHAIRATHKHEDERHQVVEVVRILLKGNANDKTWNTQPLDDRTDDLNIFQNNNTH